MELSKCSILQKAILPCRECGASCSRYVTVEPDRPKTTSDYDTIGWSLPRRNDNAHIDYENGWCVEFEAPRESLQSNHDCGRYEARSQVFREHECPAGSCEFFQNPVQFLCRPPPCLKDFSNKGKLIRGIPMIYKKHWNWFGETSDRPPP